MHYFSKITAAALLASMIASPAFATMPPKPAWEFQTPVGACMATNTGNPAFTNHWAVELEPGTWLSVYNGFTNIQTPATWANVSNLDTYSPANYFVSNTVGKFKINLYFKSIVSCIGIDYPAE